MDIVVVVAVVVAAADDVDIAVACSAKRTQADEWRYSLR